MPTASPRGVAGPARAAPTAPQYAAALGTPCGRPAAPGPAPSASRTSSRSRFKKPNDRREKKGGKSELSHAASFSSPRPEPRFRSDAQRRGSSRLPSGPKRPRRRFPRKAEDRGRRRAARRLRARPFPRRAVPGGVGGCGAAPPHPPSAAPRPPSKGVLLSRGAGRALGTKRRRTARGAASTRFIIVLYALLSKHITRKDETT